MKLKYLYPHWGSEQLSVTDFFDLVRENGFDGIEMNIPADINFEIEFQNTLNKERNANADFICCLQQVFGVEKESPKAYLEKVVKRLTHLVEFQPDFINSHTGKDHYSFEENCRIIEAVEAFSAKSGIPVYHEIHRGRFTFHSEATLRYLEKFPQLKFVGDFSHWCVVSESLLQDQEEAVQRVIPNIAHLHARVGTEQASQVNNPFAPEWSKHLARFTKFWLDTLVYHKNSEVFSITPEFGPFPYMPQAPFTEEPMANQQEVNIKMRDYLKTKF